jgi:hypothetical protein
MLHMHTYDPNFNLGLGYSDDNEHSLVAGKVDYFDGTSRRALYEFATMKIFLLPDPPNPTFDRAHLYTTPLGKKIPRDLWEIMFYTVKPFVDEELCNHVKSKKSSLMSCSKNWSLSMGASSMFTRVNGRLANLATTKRFSGLVR